MIKRIIACLTICLIITGLISPVFSNASALPQPNWSDPGISEIINISDLTGWMLNGGTFDVSTYTDAESFMNDYYTARSKTRLEGPDYVIKSSFGLEQQYYTVGDSAYAHPLDVNRAIASAFREHSGYGRRFSNEVNEALLGSGSLYNVHIPLLSDVEFANFVGYNHDALRLYSEFFTTNDVVPNPDPNYITYINTLNGNSGNGIDFFWKNYSFNNGSFLSVPNSTTSVSYCLPSNNWSQTSGTIVTNYFTSNFIISDLITFNINKQSNDLYTITMNGYNPYDYNNWVYNFQHAMWKTQNNTITYYGDYVNNNTFNNSWVYQYTSFSDKTLNECFTFLTYNFRNVNIYVDGEPWALVNTPTSNTLTPEFPDAVGGEDLPNTTWPVFRPRAPYYTSVPGMLQAVEDAIADDGKLDIDDLKPYLTDENGVPVTDPQFDPEPVPIPVPDPINQDIVPGLPILPAIPPNMPGYNGVSVLAEIINFTNQSLPTSLIVTFWGIVFGIVILGLIKILHK